ncbi:Mur ligase family protein [Candidatus Hydrogenosomobacter endosymbioticus]|uniref:UDP-N-acetylmuramoyl-L-alanyl-D-glutamate--2,6-diaminopimelate ligase n=1 Tax=Candidatus Hydrogenosomobacter endosymbioticus TaxID=2558174 RepID=A0ABN6L2H4_9PROT|nr:UDP-N-acetylmuramoyl-L-alanyl-D-glutamate--2,6-diaminopimelate ligase [Candidatus Hydrogenosomobacter endosymbioticus]BDB96073.1 hypothetical protein HYD_2060 [Candidatus Hydrogenosomobacter endosymbioticus]
MRYVTLADIVVRLREESLVFCGDLPLSLASANVGFVVDDSRKIQNKHVGKFVFVAVSGAQSNGGDFICEAVAKGAVAVVIEPSALPKECIGDPAESAFHESKFYAVSRPSSCTNDLLISKFHHVCSNFDRSIGAERPEVGFAEEFTKSKNCAGALNKKNKIFTCAELKNKTILVKDARAALSEICNILYDSIPEKIVAITGTDGKTSITECVRKLWKADGRRAASIGTLGVQTANCVSGNIGIDQLLMSGTHSFSMPGIVSLYEILSGLGRKGVSNIVMEATSHGLHQMRLGKIKSDVGIFSSFHQDHLDYHKSMSNYFEAKMLLFARHVKPHGLAFIHKDIPYIERISEMCSKKCIDMHLYGEKTNGSSGEVGLSYSVISRVDGGEDFSIGKSVGKEELDLPHQSSQYLIDRDLIINESGTIEKLDTIGKESEYSSFVRFNIFGESFIDKIKGVACKFQLDNATAAIGAFVACGGRIEVARGVINELFNIRGRMELVARTSDGALVFVDYAHTPGALRSALAQLRETIKVGAKICVVFGCGGDRDPSKRMLMGEIASQHSDFVFVTDDNPRSEDASSIRAEIMKGVAASKSAVVKEIAGRRAAIEEAVSTLRAGDVLLIAGKGHEEFQIVGGSAVKFSDSKCAAEACRRK